MFQAYNFDHLALISEVALQAALVQQFDRKTYRFHVHDEKYK